MDPRKTACVAIIIALATKRRVKRKRWMKEWLKKREQYSHVLLLNEIRITEPEDYKNYFRMNDITFEKLLKLVTPFLLRKDTNMRRCLPVKERLAVTLRYLATGRNFEDLKFSAVMSPSSVSSAIIETCEVLIYVLQDYLKVSTLPSFLFISECQTREGSKQFSKILLGKAYTVIMCSLGACGQILSFRNKFI